MSFAGISDLRQSYDDGKSHVSAWRKNGLASAGIGFFSDLNFSAGTPRPFYYASSPLAFAPLSRSDGGIYLPQIGAADRMWLKRLAWTAVATTGPIWGQLLDLVGYIPFIDESLVGEEQLVDNALGPPARVGAGDGVMAYGVFVAPPGLTTGMGVTITYTNSKGVSGRVSRTSLIQFTNGANGSLIMGMTGANGGVNSLGLFFALQSGDVGIRTIESVRVDGAGDVGLFTIVLCRIVADLPQWLPGTATTDVFTAEVDFVRQRPFLPAVSADAFLNMIVVTQSSAVTPLYGEAEFVWR